MDIRVSQRFESATGAELLRVGGCVLDTGRGVLTAADGTETTLRPKTMDLAELLMRNPGRVVSRAELLDAVWPGVFVTDDSVTQCVTELRRAMGSDGAALLKTLPRRGYVLEGKVTVTPVPPPSVVKEPAEPTAPGAPVPFAATATNDTDRLAASSAAERSMELWREGRAVLRSSGRIVETRLRARAVFEQAIELDPQNFRALSEAAFTYTNAVLGGQSLTPEADLARAASLTERAVAIESQHDVTHTARAAVLRLQRRHAEALQHYTMAVAINPDANASRANIGWMLLLLGRGEEAATPVLACLAAGGSLQLRGAWLTYIGLIELHTGTSDNGVARLREALDHEAFMPKQERLVYLVAALALNGEAEAARHVAADIAGRFPEVNLDWFAGRAQSDHPVYRAQFERILGVLRGTGLPE
jgi:DNA-binding winged helix-turn-helix (wHTH) protein